MSTRAVCTAVLLSFFFLSFLTVHPASSEDRPVLEQNKAEIIDDIESLVQGLHKTRDCVAEAKTEAEFKRCHESVKVRKFLEVQDKLNEIGLSREERRMRRPPHEQ